MSRLLAGFVAIVLTGVVTLDHSSAASSAGHPGAAVPAVRVGLPLRHALEAEISRLRHPLPTEPLILPRSPTVPRPLIEDGGVPCFVSGPSRCSDIPCREFVSASPVTVAAFGASSVENAHRLPRAPRLRIIPPTTDPLTCPTSPHGFALAVAVGEP